MTRPEPPAERRPLVFTRHAKLRMLEMGVTEEECVSARDNPTSVSWSEQYSTWVYRGRRVSVAIGRERDPSVELVATVIWKDPSVFPVLSPERGRAAAVVIEKASAVAKAWSEPGVAPAYHRQAQRKLAREWPVLAEAVKALVEAEQERQRSRGGR